MLMIRPTYKYLVLAPIILVTFAAFGMETAISAKEQRRLERLVKGEKRIIAEREERLLSRKQNIAPPHINYHQAPTLRHIYYETDPLIKKEVAS